MSAWRCICLALLALGLNACAYSIHEVQVSDFRPYQRLETGAVVKGYAEQFVILGFTTQTDYVNDARTDLIKKCPGGDISGITTQISTSLGFFSWTNKALLQGLCSRTQATSAKTRHARL